jgi:hypothetical protein
MKIIKKILILSIITALIFSFATSVFAASTSFSTKKVFGKSSQELTTEFKDQDLALTLNVTSVSFNGNSGWKIRAYSHYDVTTCSDLSDEITGTGNWSCSYTSDPDVVTVKSSISSSTYTTYLYFSGSLTT